MVHEISLLFLNNGLILMIMIILLKFNCTYFILMLKFLEMIIGTVRNGYRDSPAKTTNGYRDSPSKVAND